MRRMTLALAALICAASISQTALAQRPGRKDEDEREAKLPPNVPPPVSTLVPVRGISGPRLQPGAVLCRSEFDLQNRAEVNRRRIDNVPDPGNPLENCHLLNQERGVEIVERHGLGRTEVKVKPTGEVGWTDALVR